MAAAHNTSNPNHPFVVWGSCFLWLTSMFAITWSLLLFFCVGDILVLTGTDVVNAIVLLSGVIMLPTNVHILCSIAYGRKIDPKSKVVCCPLWLCILWIILVNLLGACCCIEKIYAGKHSTAEKMDKTIKHYRSVPKYKHFIDNLQWSLRCCGLNSYKDWFDHDWYDKIRDYEWDPNNKRDSFKRKEMRIVTDSVPLSCCKSGSCISNYLMELGTHSINTKGCGNLMNRIIISSMIAHLIMFLSVVIVEVIILRLISRKNVIEDTKRINNMHVRHIMSVNNRFGTSSASLQINPDDSDVENEIGLVDMRRDRRPSKKMLHDRVKIDDDDSESPKETKKWEDDYDDEDDDDD